MLAGLSSRNAFLFRVMEIAAALLLAPAGEEVHGGLRDCRAGGS